MRVAAQVASGIGFIGAGAIIRDRGSVRGVTTAAALWTSAALGLAAGAGLWAVAAAGAVVPLRPTAAHDRRRVREGPRDDGPSRRCDTRRGRRDRRPQHPRLERRIYARGRNRRARARPRRPRGRDTRAHGTAGGGTLLGPQATGLPR